MIEFEIAKPCNQSWTAMKGDERVRFCAGCRKNVYNIGQMTEAEVETLVRETEGHFCARLYRRTDQRVLTTDCPKGVAAVRRRIGLAVAAAMSILAGYSLFSPTIGQVRLRRTPIATSPPPSEPEPVTPILGKVRVPDVRMGQITVIPRRSPGKEITIELPEGS